MIEGENESVREGGREAGKDGSEEMKQKAVAERMSEGVVYGAAQRPISRQALMECFSGHFLKENCVE